MTPGEKVTSTAGMKLNLVQHPPIPTRPGPVPNGEGTQLQLYYAAGYKLGKLNADLS